VSGIVSARPVRFLTPHFLPHPPVIDLAARISGMAGQALLAWIFAAVPAVILMTAMLTGLLRRIPAVHSAQAGD
jgi:H+/gluconate symporter-like permease